MEKEEIRLKRREEKKLERKEFIKKAKGVYCYMECNRNSIAFLVADLRKNLRAKNLSKLNAFYEIRACMYGFDNYMKDKKTLEEIIK